MHEYSYNRLTYGPVLCNAYAFHCHKCNSVAPQLFRTTNGTGRWLHLPAIKEHGPGCKETQVSCRWRGEISGKVRGREGEDRVDIGVTNQIFHFPTSWSPFLSFDLCQLHSWSRSRRPIDSWKAYAEI